MSLQADNESLQGDPLWPRVSLRALELPFPSPLPHGWASTWLQRAPRLHRDAPDFYVEHSAPFTCSISPGGFQDPMTKPERSSYHQTTLYGTSWHNCVGKLWSFPKIVSEKEELSKECSVNSSTVLLQIFLAENGFFITQKDIMRKQTPTCGKKYLYSLSLVSNLFLYLFK